MLSRRPINAAFYHKMNLLLERIESDQRWVDLLYWSERWISFGQVQESAFRGLIMAHAANGDRTALSAAYQRCERAYEEGLGLSPPRTLQEIYHRLMRGEM
jgi:DNA-binding SARP family transcriptional activator